MLKSRTYTEQVLRWKLIPPCYSLIMSMAAGADSQERPVARDQDARASRDAFLNALLKSLLPGNSRCGRGSATGDHLSRFVASPFRGYRRITKQNRSL
jgi:hypothetical protein